MAILALDPGRVTGWAASDGTCGTVDLHSDDDGRALWTFEKWLDEKIARAGRALTVLVERPIFTGRIRGADFTIGLACLANKVAFQRGLARAEMTANDVRKAVFGKATGHKDRARIDKARALGWALTSNHAADAALLLSAYCGTKGIST